MAGYRCPSPSGLDESDRYIRILFAKLLCKILRNIAKIIDVISCGGKPGFLKISQRIILCVEDLIRLNKMDIFVIDAAWNIVACVVQ